MDITTGPLEIIDQEVGEIGAMLRTLIFIAEAADPAERDALRPGAIAMLYTMIDKSHAASRAIGEINRLAARNIVRTPCDKTMSHRVAQVARFLFRSARPKR